VSAQLAALGAADLAREGCNMIEPPLDASFDAEQGEQP